MNLTAIRETTRTKDIDRPQLKVYAQQTLKTLRHKYTYIPQKNVFLLTRIDQQVVFYQTKLPLLI